MNVIDDLYGRVVFQVTEVEFKDFLEKLKSMKSREIEDIKQKIDKYEQKRRAEEAMYQSLSSIRKFFTGRPPIHHQAVEYMVYVKDRFKKIEMIKRSMGDIDQVLDELKENSGRDDAVLSPALIEEIQLLKEGRASI
ncbi:hypothetical protein [Metabacillus sp. RGM 3146]|uniref:hypothetical protein n=1 Tax=Metabacillus sp. RGM 3146 TaxID=3401092 RepID=UPI003B9C65D5